jgi:hypothetical protein
MDFVFDSKILSIKEIIKSATGVFMYTVSEKISRQNPLYDDIIQLPTGEIIALVNKTSQQKRSLLSITDSDSDYVFLIGQDTRERKTLFKTPKNGQMLRYKNDEILFIDTNGEVFVVNNL